MATINSIDAPTKDFLQLAGGTMTGNLILNGSPSVGNQACNKTYADAIAAGFALKQSCVCASTGNYTCLYVNGTAGVGATMTNTGGLAPFIDDGITPTINQRILIKNQTSTFQNGIYQISTLGSGAVAWVLTRVTDYDSAAEMASGSCVVVTGGIVNANSFWVQNATVTTVGSDPVLFVAISFASGTYLTIANNLSDVANAGTARTNLGLGTAATHASSDYLLVANNLSDVNATTARTNLGLGTAAQANTSQFCQVANNLSDVNSTTTALTNLNGQVRSAMLTSLTSAGSNFGFLVSDGSSNALTRAVVGTTNRISVSNGGGLSGDAAVDIDAAYIGQTSITTVGTLTTGHYTATVINPAYGGTGRNNGNNTIDLSAGGALAMTGGGFPLTFNVGSSSIVTISGTGTMLTSANGLVRANNLSDVVNAGTSRTNLGLGTVATLAQSAVALTANNLSDLANKGSSRDNLQLGSNNDVTFASVTTPFLLIQTAGSSGVSLYTDTSAFVNQSYQLPLDYPPDGTYALTGASGVMQWTKFAQSASGRVLMTVISSTGNTTYTPTAGMVYADVQIVGAGGGGQYGLQAVMFSAAVLPSVGGSAGGYARKIFTAAQIGASRVVSIGTGGAGGLVGSRAGGNGTSTTFGALMTGAGGAGGVVGSNGTPTPGTPGGGTSGTLNITGQAGQFGSLGFSASVITLSTASYNGGTGGASALHPGGGAGYVSDYSTGTCVDGSAGVNGAGGGSGAASINHTTDSNGGAGGNGLCIIIEYCS